MRDLAGLDSLAQSAGRCNRHGLRPQQGRVHIVELPEPPRQLKRFARVGPWRERSSARGKGSFQRNRFRSTIPNRCGDITSSRSIADKDEMSFNIPARTAGRDTTLLDLLGSNKAAQTAADRTGQSPSRPVLLAELSDRGRGFQAYRGDAGNCGSLRARRQARSSTRSLPPSIWRSNGNCFARHRQYTVSVYDHQFRKLRDADAIYEAQPDAGSVLSPSAVLRQAIRAKHRAGNHGGSECLTIMGLNAISSSFASGDVMPCSPILSHASVAKSFLIICLPMRH